MAFFESMTLISKVLTQAISNLSRRSTGHDQETPGMMGTKTELEREERDEERARRRGRGGTWKDRGHKIEGA